MKNKVQTLEHVPYALFRMDMETWAEHKGPF